jgi:hypothetical protein
MTTLYHYQQVDGTTPNDAVNIDTLSHLVGTGQLNEDCFVWYDGCTEWVPIKESDIYTQLYPHQKREQQVFEVGAKVEAKCDGWRNICPGKIIRVHGDVLENMTYDIDFYNGEREKKVRKSMLRSRLYTLSIFKSKA